MTVDIKEFMLLSNDIACGSDVTPYTKVDLTLVVYRFVAQRSQIH